MSGSHPVIGDTTGMPKVGERVGDRYVVVRLVGHGGFASVFEARDEKAGGRVALKVLSPEKSVDFKFAGRFEQEIRIVRELRHPNTIRIWDLGTTSRGLLYAVMEYVEGSTLDEDLFRHGAMSQKRAKKVGEQLLKGLAEAHALGIVHRDLKPENVMLCEIGGEADFVKILDFGIAKSLVEDLSLVRTQTGVVMGTPGYAAPEVLMGEPVTPAADVYAVGLILAEMLSGVPVVQGESVADVLVSQMSLTPEAIVAELPEGAMSRVIAKAVAHEAAARYVDAGEMLQDLRAGGRDTTAPRRAVGGAASLPLPLPPPNFVAPQKTTEVMSPEAQEAAERLAEAAALRKARPAGSGGELVTLAQRPTAPAPALLRADGDAVTGAPEAAEDRHRLRLAALLLFLLLGAGAAIALILADLGGPAAPEGGAEASRETLPAESAGAGTGADAPDSEALAFVPLSDLPGPAAERLSWDWLAESGGADVDALAVLRGDRGWAEVDDREERPPTVRGYLIESVRLNQQALEMLQSAMRDEDDAAQAVGDPAAELLGLYETLIDQLLEADLCAAAQRRLEHAYENVTLLGEEAPTRLASLQERVDACAPARAPGVAAWRPRRFLALIARGGSSYREARELGPGEEEERVGVLQRALADFEEARELLLTALDNRDVPPSRVDQMRANLAWLDARVVMVRASLDECAAAELHFDEAFARAEPTTVSALDPVALAAEREVAACRARELLAGKLFDLAAFRQLVALAADLYARAMALRGSRRPASVLVRITSEPSGARVERDGESLGRTPLEARLPADAGEVVLTLRRVGYQRERVRFDTGQGDVERHVVLEEENPFGRVGRIGGTR